MNKNNIWASLIIGLSVIITAIVLSSGFKNRNTADDVINVVGLGTINFTSDEIFWQGGFQVKAMDAKDAYNRILEDKDKVKKFFIDKGFTDNEFKFGGVQINKTYRSITTYSDDRYHKTESIFDGYVAVQSVTFTSIKNESLMRKIETVSNETSELINSGIEFQGQSLQYTYSDLPSLKHSLIEYATEDAKERAEKIIAKAKGKKGKLKNANMGVFQITGIGSNEEDTYGGIFDVYSKEKTARITVRLSYNLD